MKKEKTECFLFHDWDKWEELEFEYKGRDHIYVKQKRICKVCNKVKGRSAVYIKN